MTIVRVHHIINLPGRVILPGDYDHDNPLIAGFGHMLVETGVAEVVSTPTPVQTKADDSQTEERPARMKKNVPPGTPRPGKKRTR